MGCRALFIGGIKSGKSKNAEHYTLENSSQKPIYLATNEFFDEEMQKRVQLHQKQRENNFITIEEPLKISQVIKEQKEYVLVECVSMWINNMLHHKFTESDMLEQLKQIAQSPTPSVWVINDVSQSVISENALVRKFVDINGRIAQFLASECEDVFHVTAGISVKIK